MPIKGVCAKCGFVFLLEYGLDCPACHMADRTERVKKAFAPVDPLRTALGVEHTLTHDNIGSFYRRLAVNTHEEPEVDDKKFRIPQGEAEQIYELKRMRKLIGAL